MNGKNTILNSILKANEHINVMINGEKVSISAVEFCPDYHSMSFHFEIDKVIKSINDIQSIIIECKQKNFISKMINNREFEKNSVNLI